MENFVTMKFLFFFSIRSAPCKNKFVTGPIQNFVSILKIVLKASERFAQQNLPPRFLLSDVSPPSRPTRPRPQGDQGRSRADQGGLRGRRSDVAPPYLSRRSVKCTFGPIYLPLLGVGVRGKNRQTGLGAGGSGIGSFQL